MDSLEKYSEQNVCDKLQSSLDISNKKFLQSLSRLQQVSEKPFRVITENHIQEINDKIKEINDKISSGIVGTTQFSRKIFTLQMLQPASSTYRILRQIITQIEVSQKNVRDSIYKLKINMIRLRKLEEQIEKETDEFKKAELEIRREQIQAHISDRFAYLEDGIKEIGYLLDAYEQIKKNKNIPDNWTEEDLERDELRFNIKNVFRYAIRDVIAYGRIGTATSEIFESLGISPVEATFCVNTYIGECHKAASTGTGSYDYTSLDSFLEDMADRFESRIDDVKRVLGLSDLTTDRYLCKKNK